MDLAGRFRAESHLSQRAGTRRFRTSNRYGMASPVHPRSIVSGANPHHPPAPTAIPAISHGPLHVHAIANLALRSPAEISAPATTRERFRGTKSKHGASVDSRRLAYLLLKES